MLTEPPFLRMEPLMNRRHRTARITLSGLPLLAIGLLAGSAVVPSSAQAATLDVTNCNDAGEGSLRASIGRAASDDVVDLSNIGCSKVQLTTGAISVPQKNLTLRGAGAYRIAISGGYMDSVLRHSGTGLLKLERLTVQEGRLRDYGPAPQGSVQGACIYSAGSVSLSSVEVHHCIGDAREYAEGGGIWAKLNVLLQNSRIYNAKLYGASRSGGGIYTRGKVTLDLSSVLNSVAGEGAAIFSNGTTLSRSLISGNNANVGAAAIDGGGRHSTIISSTISNNQGGAKWGVIGGYEIEIINSTISNNTAKYAPVDAYDSFGGLVRGGNVDGGIGLTISNSTIANNTFINESGAECKAATAQGYAIHMESSIIANNSCDGAPAYDVQVRLYNTENRQVTGANNLVMHPEPTTTMPADTLSTDPQLQPLANNGGLYATQALGVSSPALDTGNNAAGLIWDQRGPDFPRVKNGRADIGAFER